MLEQAKMYLDDAREQMNKSIEHLDDELTKVRAGAASPNMVSGLSVDYYGAITPITQAANVSAQDAKTLVIQPWDKTLIPAIERSILEANIGVTPQSDGEAIRLILPPMTEERRKELVKQVKSIGENTKVSLRNVRRDAIQGVKSLVKEGLSEDQARDCEEEIQQLTTKFGVDVDKILKAKEEKIMTV